MKGPFKLKYNKSSFPFKEEDGNAIVAAAASANEPVERGESVAASFLSGFASGLSQPEKKKDENKDKDKDKNKNKKAKPKRNPNKGSYPSTGKYAFDTNRNGILDYLEKPDKKKDKNKDKDKG